MVTTSDETAALADTVRDELSTLGDDVAKLSGDLTADLARALVKGEELDGLLQSLILKQSDSIVNSSLNQVFDTVGSLGESVVGSAIDSLTGSTANIFNVNVAASDPASFRSSETQLASSLARVVSRGQSSL